jgi:hypothetical protein
MVPYAEQDDFKIDNLPEVKKMAATMFWRPDGKKLFGVFEI